MIETKKYYKKEDMNRLDCELEFIPLTYDGMFKGIFKKRLDILKLFILSQLELEISPDDCTIELLDSELPKDNKKEYQKTVDIYVKINNMFVNIEINREYFRDVVMRNLMFADKLYVGMLERGEAANNLKNKIFIQINLNAMDRTFNEYEKLKYGNDVVAMKSLRTDEIYNKNKYIMIKYLEYYRDLYYNEGVKLNTSEMWLVLLSSRTFLEVYNVSKFLFDRKLHQEFIRKVIDMSRDRYLIEDWELEQLNELVEITKYENAMNDGHKEGFKQGHKEGLVQGLEQGVEECIKNMLKDDMDIELICKVSNKTKDEIMEIQKKI